MANDFKLSSTDIANNDILYYITKKYINMYRADPDFVKRLNNILKSLSINRYLFIDNDLNVCLSKPQRLATTDLIQFIRYLIYNKIIINTRDRSFVLDLNFKFDQYRSNIRIIPSYSNTMTIEYHLAEVYNYI